MVNLKRKDTILNFSQRIAGCTQQHREHQTVHILLIENKKYSIHYYHPVVSFLSVYLSVLFLVFYHPYPRTILYMLYMSYTSTLTLCIFLCCYDRYSPLH